MSFLLKSIQQFSYLNNKEREHFFLSEDDDDDDEFNFKYVPTTQFKNVVKNVRRQKVKMDEERTWESFVKRQESLEGSETMLNNFDPRAMSNVKEFLQENIGNVDRELKRLEDDTMPEINKIYKSIDGVQGQEVEPVMQKRSPMMKETGTGSSNILLMIPEEGNSLQAYRQLPKTKPRHGNNTRESSSDHLVLRKDHSRKLLRAMDHSEYNSSPEPSPDRNSEKEEEGYFTRPDLIVIQKVLGIQKKVSSVLDEISFRLDRIPLPDGEKDLSRRLQRVAEFSVRFSRNYLYDLGRQITDMQQHIRAIASDARPIPSRRSFAFHIHTIGQKMVTAHQILLQALIAYCKHIPSSIVKGHPGKLKEILQIVKDLKDMCNKVNITSEHYGSGDADMQQFTKETHRKCSLILSKLQLKGLGSDNDSQVLSHTTQSTIAAPAPSRLRRRGKQKRLSSRLSMYSMEANARKLCPIRRSSTCFPKEKKYANTNSKYLQYNHSSRPKQPNSSPATNKSSSKETVKNCPPRVRHPPREDDIKTMMDITPPADSDVGSSVEAVPMNRYSSTNFVAKKPEVPRQHSTRQKIPSHIVTTKDLRKVKSNKKVSDDRELKKQVTMITEEHLSSLVPVIADLMSVVTSKQNDFEIRPVSSASMETLLEFLQKYQSPQNETRKSSSPKSDRSKEIRTGPKNAQLICLPYNEKMDKESKCGDFPCGLNLEVLKETGEHSTEETSVRLAGADINDELKSGVQLVVPIATVFIIPEYHQRYHSFIQESPMYLSNTNNKPWDVVAWIADKLVDELVTEISKELQMENVIKKMFDLEFEEF